MPKFSPKDPSSKLKELYLKARDAYYNDPNGKTLMSDEEFDDLEDLIREREPKWVGLKSTGISTKNKKTKVPLEFYMPSLDKVKSESVDKWIGARATKTAVVSDKLDGSSIQLKYVKGEPSKLVTRGDGITGGDISFLIPHLKIPKKVGTATFSLRCEGLFSKSAFLKYKAEFDAARNAASGIFNRQDPHRATKDLSIVVLKVLDPAVPPSKGLAWAKAKGFTVVPHVVVPFSKLNAVSLTKLLEKRRATSKFQLDGLVIEEDKVNRVTKDRPDWAKAFKSNVSAESAPVTTIKAVHWDISPRAQIIPRIEFDPVVFDGAKVRFASAFNAKYVREKGIGVGGKVAILRSGEIIPFIARVVKPVTPSKPDPKIIGEYLLDARGTNYVLAKPAENDDFRIQRLLKFFKTLSVDFIKLGTVTKLYGLGFKTVKSMVHMKPVDLVKVGVTQASAEKLCTSIDNVLGKGVVLPLLMDASGTFPHGMGRLRFESIAAEYDLFALLSASPSEQESALSKLSGFGSSTTQAFIKGAPKFLKWLSLVQIKIASPKKVTQVKTSNKLDKVSVTFTGYRDKDQESQVLENGGQIVPFGGKTTVLLVSLTGKTSSKEDKATEKGIPVMTWDKFSRKYAL